jgi:hypothetical protein
MEKRLLKGQDAIDHLKAKGTLWSADSESKKEAFWQWNDHLRKPAEIYPPSISEHIGFFDQSIEREVRTDPPARDVDREMAEAICAPKGHYVGDIVTGDEAYRLVELGAKVVSGDEIDQSPGLGYVVVDGEFAFDMGHGLLNTTTKDSFVSHARRTLWNPDADEWCIVEPPKTITAEEARKVVAAGGAVARTFVAPESEWADGSVNNGPGTKSVADFAYALFADGSEWVVRRAAPEKPSVLTAEELADVEFAEANYLYGLSVRLAATVRSLEKELTKVTKEYSDLCAQWRAR